MDTKPVEPSHPVANWAAAKTLVWLRQMSKRKPAMMLKSAVSAVSEKVIVAPPEVKLLPKQQWVVDAVRSGRNVFFSGMAGTGKSYLLEYLIKYVLPLEGTHVTSSTGLSALNVGGITIHSFSGIRNGEGTKEKLAKMVNDNKGQRKRWQEARTLIIDEISMISGRIFDKLEYVARVVRGNSRPFGGVQLIITGDFFQLPPVDRYEGKISFCFQADSWNNVVQIKLELDQVVRQKDEALIRILNDTRKGKVTEEMTIKFQSRVGVVLDCSDGIEPQSCTRSRRR